MAAAVLERVKTVAADRRQEQTDKFAALVIHLADGAEADPDNVIEVLDATGRSDSDLSSAVELLTRRRELAAQMKAGETAKEERQALQAKIEAAERELRAAQELYVSKTQPLTFPIAEAERVVRAARDAHRELIATAPAALRQRQAEITSSRDHLDRQRADLQATQSKAAKLAIERRDMAATSPNFAEEYQREAADLERRVKEYQAAIAAIDGDLEQLSNEGREAVAAMLRP